MNTNYRLIYNELTNTWVAVSEASKGRGKRTSGAVLLAAVGLLTALAQAPALAAPPNPPAPTQLPTGGQVVAGQANISQSAATLTVNQSSTRAAIDWQTFNVGSQARVNFKQPSASSVTLNRVLDANPSQIFGRISAPGQVFLTNPNGVYFSPTASVDVGALVATTHSISNADFMAGGNTFTRNAATGSVVNDGNLTASLGGYIALLAPEVRNNGIIVAQLGTVVLAAGEAFELQFDGSRLTNIRVEPATIAALVENGNAVQAPGGLIILSAQAANHLQGGVVNNSGSLEATGLVDNGGVIRLEASDRIVHSGSIKVDAAAGKVGAGGTATLIASLANPDSVTEISGSISARGGDQGGDGGFVETSGGRVQIGDTARVDTRASQGKTGTWLLDPDGFTIAATGGDITGATLSTNLGTADVSITSASGTHDGTSGNVNVNDSVAWSAHLLTLSATNNININANMNATGSASLALVFGQGAVASGNTSNIITAHGAAVNLPAGTNNFTTRQGSDGVVKNYTVITSLGAEGSMTHTDLQGINGDVTLNYALGGNIDATATSTWNAGKGFAPLVGAARYLNMMDDTYITQAQYDALSRMQQRDYMPVLSSFSGNLDGLGHTISNLSINRPAESSVGLFGGTDTGAVIRNVGLVGGSITGYSNVGGLAGVSGGQISYSYTTGTVNGSYTAGGLVGRLNFGQISYSYTTGAVNGIVSIGGLVGDSAGKIDSSFATGDVRGGTFQVGGLVGVSFDTISNSYATGRVVGTEWSVGGLIGFDFNNTASNSFYNIETSGQTKGRGNSDDAAGQVWGMSTADMKQVLNFTTATAANGNVNPAWDFTTPVWKIVTGANNGYPCMAWSAACGTPLYLRLIAGSSIYGDSPSLGYALYDASSGGNVIANASPIGTVTWSNPLSATSDANTYDESYVSGITLGNFDFSLSAGGSINWVITPRPLNLTASKTYDGSTGFNSGYVLTGMVNGNSQPTVSGSADVSSANAATYSSFSSSTLALDNGNYTLTGGSVAATIDKAHLTVTADPQSRLYGAANPGFTQTISGFVNGESLGTSGVAGSATGSSKATTGTAVGSATIAVSNTGLSASNYDFPTWVNGTLTIDKAHLTVTADNQSRLYGAANTTLSTTVSGFVNSEVLGTSGVTGTGSATTTAVPGTNVGTAAISVGAGSLTATNYDFTTLTAGTLTIDKAHLTVTADSQSRLYGAANPTLTTTVSGFVNGQNLSSSGVTGAGSATTTAVPTTNVGTAAITAASGTLAASNYDFTTLTDGTLTIDKAHLTVTADNQSRLYGAANPTLTTTVSGFVNGQNLSTSGVTGAGSATTTAAPTTNVGTAAISAASGTLTASNYDFTTLTAGTLTIAKAHLTVTADNQSRLYGAANPSLTSTITGYVNNENASSANVNGTPTQSTTATATTVGTASITAAANNLAAANYDFAYVSGTMNIDKVTYDALQASADSAVISVLHNVSPRIPQGSVPDLVSAPSSSSAPATAPTSETVSATPTTPTPQSTPVPALATTPVPAVEAVAKSSAVIDAPPAGTGASAGVSLVVMTQPTRVETGIVSVSLPKGTSTEGVGFRVPLPIEVATPSGPTLTQATGTAAPSTAPAIEVLAVFEGRTVPLPAWLRYAPAQNMFVAAAVPDGGLPITIEITVAGQRTLMVISERAN